MRYLITAMGAVLALAVSLLLPPGGRRQEGARFGWHEAVLCHGH
jgi:hypothetical protein